MCPWQWRGSMETWPMTSVITLTQNRLTFHQTTCICTTLAIPGPQKSYTTINTGVYLCTCILPGFFLWNFGRTTPYGFFVFLRFVFLSAGRSIWMVHILKWKRKCFYLIDILSQQLYNQSNTQTCNFCTNSSKHCHYMYRYQYICSSIGVR